MFSDSYSSVSTSYTLDPLKQAQQAALAVNKIIGKFSIFENTLSPSTAGHFACFSESTESEIKTSQPTLQEVKPVELTENQKQILGMTSTEDPSASLEQQVELTLKGKEQRLLLMQKLMQRKTESKVIVLRNMVCVEDVDEYLESEITGKDQLR
jgi:hypothetical protein